MVTHAIHVPGKGASTRRQQMYQCSYFFMLVQRFEHLLHETWLRLGTHELDSLILHMPADVLSISVTSASWGRSARAQWSHQHPHSRRG